MERRYRTYALLTFVTDVEKEQILALFEWEIFYLRNDNGIYYRTYIVRDGAKLPIVAVGQKEKGSIASATLVMKCIDQFRPEYVISGGIAAGVPFKHKDVQPDLGDVVVADSTWNLSKGKYTDISQTELSEGPMGYIPRPTMTSIHQDTRKLLMRLCKSRENPVRTHIGTYLSSGSVIANSHFIEKAILSSNLIAKALDMESFGISYACEMASSDKPTPIIAKGISDFADEQKSDTYQKLAAENSANFISYLLMNLPADPDMWKEDEARNKLFSGTLQTAGRSIHSFFERKAKDTKKMQLVKEFEKELNFLSELKESQAKPLHFDCEHISFDAIHISANAQEFSFLGCRSLNGDMAAVNISSPIGKGIPSSFLISSVQSCFEAFIDSGITLSDCVSRTNQFLSSTNLMHVLYESWIGVIDNRDHSIHYINAGHPAPFIIRNNGSIEEVRDGHKNPKLGLKGASFAESHLHYEPGETMFLFSGGIEECRNAEGEVYGRKRLKRMLLENKNKTAKEFALNLRQSLTQFLGKEYSEKDWAMIRIEFKGDGSPEVFQGHIVDIIHRRIFDGCIDVCDGTITSVSECRGLSSDAPYILPGFIDSHVHIESSMLTPAQFAGVAAGHGTIGVVSDPHEIANVLGVRGIDFMLENASGVDFNFCFGAPSCVPSCSSNIESGGAVLSSKDVEELLQRPQIGFLSEMMNFPGVLSEDPEVLAKIEAAGRAGKRVDGHAPGLLGEKRARYAQKGITTDHECTTYEEGLSCIENDMNVLIREGSAAKNYEALIPLLSLRPDKVMFCTDDCHPGDFVSGHINDIVKRAINDGYDIWDILRAASLNPQEHYNLNWGLLREGDPATFIMADSLSPSMRILDTFIRGKRPGMKKAGAGNGFPNIFEAEKISAEDIYRQDDGPVPVILASDGELFTSSEYAGRDDASYPWAEVQKIVVVNRYCKGVPPAVGYVRGFNIKDGAMAASIAHDCHNIVAIGSSDEQIVRVVNEVISMHGGLASMCGKDKISRLELPIAGIMSPLDGMEVARLNGEVLDTIAEAGCTMCSPFITMSFMCLPVIPQVKITDKGVFDIEKWDFI